MKLDRRVMETPALEQLMGAYLHQDYGLVGDVADNVDAFMAEEPDLARRLPDEIAMVLQIHDNAAELDAFVSALGCQVQPGAGGYREMLDEITARVVSR
jgi:hypothetical protein